MKNFIVSYKRNEVYQALIVKAASLDEAESFFRNLNPDAILYGVREQNDISEEMRKGMPIITAK